MGQIGALGGRRAVVAVDFDFDVDMDVDLDVNLNVYLVRMPSNKTRGCNYESFTGEQPADATLHAQGHLGHLGIGGRRQHDRTQRVALDDEDGVGGDDMGVDVDVDRRAEPLQCT